MTAPHTRYFGWNKLVRNASVSEDNYKILGADRDSMDLLMHVLFNHTHAGGTAASATAPSTAPELLLDHDFGSLPANTRIYYCYTLVDAEGFESPPSPVASTDTPAALGAPNAPVLTPSNTGGTLLPGQYLYVLSAWKDANTFETMAPNQNAITIPAGSVTNKITLTLPTLPSGAEGFNVYRRKQSASDWEWLAEIDMTVATPPAVFVDDGSWAEDCNRSLPRRNTSNAQNEVTVSLPGATPVVPLGHTWKLYRSYINGDFSTSLVHWIVEETSEGSGVITPSYVDTGIAASDGSPPSSALDVQLPPPLSPAALAYYEAITWDIPGVQSTFVGKAPWLCTYDAFVITEVLLILNFGSTPASTDLIYDVDKYDTHLATPASVTIFTTQAHRPRVVVGNRESSSVVPDVTVLLRGDQLTVDCDQAGGGAGTDAGAQLIVCGYGLKNATLPIDFPEV
jgi:hypothetical protein